MIGRWHNSWREQGKGVKERARRCMRWVGVYSTEQVPKPEAVWGRASFRKVLCYTSVAQLPGFLHMWNSGDTALAWCRAQCASGMASSCFGLLLYAADAVPLVPGCASLSRFSGQPLYAGLKCATRQSPCWLANGTAV